MSRSVDTREEQERRGTNDPELTLKQELFVLNYVDPSSPAFGNATKAAELAGYKGKPGSNQLAVQGHENLRKPNIYRAVESILEKSGCGLELAAQRLHEALNAERVKVVFDKGRFFYSIPVADHRERRQAAELIFRLRGVLPTPSAQELEEYRRFEDDEEKRQREALRLGGFTPEMLERVKKFKELDHIDRMLIRDLLVKTEKIIDLETQILSDERWGKPPLELEEDLRREVSRRVYEQICARNKDRLPNLQPPESPTPKR